MSKKTVTQHILDYNAGIHSPEYCSGCGLSVRGGDIMCPNCGLCLTLIDSTTEVPVRGECYICLRVSQLFPQKYFSGEVLVCRGCKEEIKKMPGGVVDGR